MAGGHGGMVGEGPIEAAPQEAVGQLTALVQDLGRRIQGYSRYEERLGSQIRSAWHWRLVTMGLLVITGIMSWQVVKPRPDIAPYLFVVDPEGVVLWQGVPGSFTVTDVMLLNRLEEWVEWARFRTTDMVVMQRTWQKAVNMTALNSEARQEFYAYMERENPLVQNPKPRVDLQIISKRVKSVSEGLYYVSWHERKYNQMGNIQEQTTWEVEAKMVVQAPRKVEEAERNRYGVQIVSYSWGRVGLKAEGQ